MIVKSKKTHGRGTKFTAFAVAFVFTVTSVIWITPATAAPTDAAAPAVLPMDTFSIPPEMGTIIKTYRGERGTGNEKREAGSVSHSPLAVSRNDRTVILIQDAHAVVDAQENIAKILDHVQKSYGIRLTALEGAKSKLDPTLFRTFPDMSIKKMVLSGYLKRGEITGVQMASIFSENENGYYGIEDWKLYEENYRAYLRAQEGREVLEAKWKAFKTHLDESRKTVYSEKMNEFQDRWEDFRAERTSLAEFLMYLVNFKKILAQDQGLPELNKLVDSVGYTASGAQEKLVPVIKTMAAEFKAKYVRGMDVKSEMNFYNRYQAFLTGQMESGQFLQYMIELGHERGFRPKLTPAIRRLLGHTETLSEIKGSELFAELQKAQETIEASLMTKPAEKEIAVKYRRLLLLQELLSLELTHETLSQYQADPGAYLDLLGDAAFKEGLAPAVEFYKLALERDLAFFKNLIARMEEQKQSMALVVAGGFHTNGLQRILEEQQISYAVVSPRMASLAGSENYAKVMRDDVSYKEFLKTTYYDAFVRDATERFVKEMNQPDFVRNLKAWRDDVIRDLSRQGRIAEAGNYTRYLDALAKVYVSKFGKGPVRSKEEILKVLSKELNDFRDKSLGQLWQRFESQLGQFIDGLKGLLDKKQITPDNVRGLLEGLNNKKPSMLGIRAVLDSKIIWSNESAEPLPGLKSEVRDQRPERAEVPSVAVEKIRPSVHLSEEDQRMIENIRMRVEIPKNSGRWRTFGFVYDAEGNPPGSDSFDIYEMNGHGVIPGQKNDRFMLIAPLEGNSYRDASGRFAIQLQQFHISDPLEQRRGIFSGFIAQLPPGTRLKLSNIMNSSTLETMKNKYFERLAALHAGKIWEKHVKTLKDRVLIMHDLLSTIQKNSTLLSVDLQELFLTTPFAKAIEKTGYINPRLEVEGGRKEGGVLQPYLLNYYAEKPGRGMDRWRAAVPFELAAEIAYGPMGVAGHYMRSEARNGDKPKDLGSEIIRRIKEAAEFDQKAAEQRKLRERWPNEALALRSSVPAGLLGSFDQFMQGEFSKAKDLSYKVDPAKRLLPVFIEHVLSSAKSRDGKEPPAQVVFLRAGAEPLYEATRVWSQATGEFPMGRLYQEWGTMQHLKSASEDREQAVLFVKYLYDKGVLTPETRRVLFVDTDSREPTVGTEMLIYKTLLNKEVIDETNTRFGLKLPYWNSGEGSAQAEVLYMQLGHVEDFGHPEIIGMELQLQRAGIDSRDYNDRMVVHGFNEINKEVSALWRSVDELAKSESVSDRFQLDASGRAVLESGPAYYISGRYAGAELKVLREVQYAGLIAGVLGSLDALGYDTKIAGNEYFEGARGRLEAIGSEGNQRSEARNIETEKMSEDLKRKYEKKVLALAGAEEVAGLTVNIDGRKRETIIAEYAKEISDQAGKVIRLEGLDAFKLAHFLKFDVKQFRRETEREDWLYLLRQLDFSNRNHLNLPAPFLEEQLLNIGDAVAAEIIRQIPAGMQVILSDMEAEEELSETPAYELGSIMGELLTDAVRHGNQLNLDKPVYIYWHLDKAKKKIQVIVFDSSSLDPKLVEATSPHVIKDLLRLGGYHQGESLIRRLVRDRDGTKVKALTIEDSNNGMRLGLRTVSIDLEPLGNSKIPKSPRSEARTRLPVPVPANIDPAKKIAHVIILSDFDGIWRLNSGKPLDPKVVGLFQNLIATGRARLAVISGSPAVALVKDPLPWQREGEPLGNLVAGLFPDQKQEVAVYGYTGGQEYDRKTGQGKFAVPIYEDAQAFAISKILLGAYIEEVLIKQIKDPGLTVAAQALLVQVQQTAFDPSFKEVGSRLMVWEPVMSVIRGKINPSVWFLDRGTEIEIGNRDSQLDFFAMERKVVQGTKSEPSLKNLKEEDLVYFSEPHCTKITRSTKYRAAASFRDKALDSLRRELPLKEDEQVLVVGFGDANIDVPMYRASDLAFHMGKTAHVEGSGLDSVVLVRGSEGSEGQKVQGTAMVLDNLYAAIGKPFREFKYFQTADPSGAWTWKSLQDLNQLPPGRSEVRAQQPGRTIAGENLYDTPQIMSMIAEGQLDGKEVFIFDYDGTLAADKESMLPEIVEKLLALIVAGKKVIILSNGNFQRLKGHFEDSLDSRGVKFTDRLTGGLKIRLYAASGGEAYDVSSDGYQRLAAESEPFENAGTVKKLLDLLGSLKEKFPEILETQLLSWDSMVAVKFRLLDPAMIPQIKEYLEQQKKAAGISLSEESGPIIDSKPFVGDLNGRSGVDSLYHAWFISSDKAKTITKRILPVFCKGDVSKAVFVGDGFGPGGSDEGTKKVEGLMKASVISHQGTTGILSHQETQDILGAIASRLQALSGRSEARARQSDRGMKEPVPNAGQVLLADFKDYPPSYGTARDEWIQQHLVPSTVLDKQLGREPGFNDFYMASREAISKKRPSTEDILGAGDLGLQAVESLVHGYGKGTRTGNTDVKGLAEILGRFAPLAHDFGATERLAAYLKEHPVINEDSIAGLADALRSVEITGLRTVLSLWFLKDEFLLDEFLTEVNVLLIETGKIPGLEAVTQTWYKRFSWVNAMRVLSQARVQKAGRARDKNPSAMTYAEKAMWREIFIELFNWVRSDELRKLPLGKGGKAAANGVWYQGLKMMELMQHGKLEILGDNTTLAEKVGRAKIPEDSTFLKIQPVMHPPSTLRILKLLRDQGDKLTEGERYFLDRLAKQYFIDFYGDDLAHFYALTSGLIQLVSRYDAATYEQFLSSDSPEARMAQKIIGQLSNGRTTHEMRHLADALVIFKDFDLPVLPEDQAVFNEVEAKREVLWNLIKAMTHALDSYALFTDAPVSKFSLDELQKMLKSTEEVNAELMRYLQEYGGQEEWMKQMKRYVDKTGPEAMFLGYSIRSWMKEGVARGNIFSEELEDVLRQLKENHPGVVSEVDKEFRTQHSDILKYDLFLLLKNLIVNALDKTVGAKTVTVKADRIERDGKTLVKFTVSDNGGGMTGEQLDRIRNRVAGFTTKELGQGKGLPGVWEIIDRYKGAMDVQSVTGSEVGHGTTFTITLSLQVEKLKGRTAEGPEKSKRSEARAENQSEFQMGGLEVKVNPSEIAEKATTADGIEAVRSEIRKQGQSELRRIETEFKEDAASFLKKIREKSDMIGFMVDPGYEAFLEEQFGDLVRIMDFQELNGRMLNAVVMQATATRSGNTRRSEVRSMDMGEIQRFTKAILDQANKMPGAGVPLIVKQGPDSGLMLDALRATGKIPKLIILYDKDHPVGRGWNDVADVVIKLRTNERKSAKALVGDVIRGSDGESLMAFLPEETHVDQPALLKILENFQGADNPELKRLACDAVILINRIFASAPAMDQDLMKVNPGMLISKLKEKGIDLALQTKNGFLVMDMEMLALQFSAQKSFEKAA